MKITDILENAFAMPITSPLYPRTEFKFINREFLIITYETDLELLKQVVPEPLMVKSNIVKFEFIRMPDSYGFGSYSEAGQVIPVSFNGKDGSYVHSMYLDNVSPIAAGREIWGFPKKYGKPSLIVDNDTLVGTLCYNSKEVARATMTYKYKEENCQNLQQSLEQSANYLLKVIPHCDGKTTAICQLVRYYLKDVVIKGAWSGIGALELFQHVNAPVAMLPIRKVIAANHFISDLTLGFGEVAFDYLKNK